MAANDFDSSLLFSDSEAPFNKHLRRGTILAAAVLSALVYEDEPQRAFRESSGPNDVYDSLRDSGLLTEVWSVRLDASNQIPHQFVVGWSEKFSLIYVAFRGTASAQDVKTDVNIYPSMESHETGIWVHGGFKAIKECMPQDLLGRFIKDKSIGTVLCGHSLGGAIATLVALDYASVNGSSPCNVWDDARQSNPGGATWLSVLTFGCPSPFFRPLPATFNLSRAFRAVFFHMIDPMDPVPFLYNSTRLAFGTLAAWLQSAIAQAVDHAAPGTISGLKYAAVALSLADKLIPQDYSSIIVGNIIWLAATQEDPTTPTWRLANAGTGSRSLRDYEVAVRGIQKAGTRTIARHSISLYQASLRARYQSALRALRTVADDLYPVLDPAVHFVGNPPMVAHHAMATGEHLEVLIDLPRSVVPSFFISVHINVNGQHQTGRIARLNVFDSQGSATSGLKVSFELGVASEEQWRTWINSVHDQGIFILDLFQNLHQVRIRNIEFLNLHSIRFAATMPFIRIAMLRAVVAQIGELESNPLSSPDTICRGAENICNVIDVMADRASPEIFALNVGNVLADRSFRRIWGELVEDNQHHNSTNWRQCFPENNPVLSTIQSTLSDLLDGFLEHEVEVNATAEQNSFFFAKLKNTAIEGADDLLRYENSAYTSWCRYQLREAKHRRQGRNIRLSNVLKDYGHALRRSTSNMTAMEQANKRLYSELIKIHALICSQYAAPLSMMLRPVSDELHVNVAGVVTGFLTFGSAIPFFLSGGWTWLPAFFLAYLSGGTAAITSSEIFNIIWKRIRPGITSPINASYTYWLEQLTGKTLEGDRAIAGAEQELHEALQDPGQLEALCFHLTTRHKDRKLVASHYIPTWLKATSKTGLLRQTDKALFIGVIGGTRQGKSTLLTQVFDLGHSIFTPGGEDSNRTRSLRAHYSHVVSSDTYRYLIDLPGANEGRSDLRGMAALAMDLLHINLLVLNYSTSADETAKKVVEKFAEDIDRASVVAPFIILLNRFDETCPTWSTKKIPDLEQAKARALADMRERQSRIVGYMRDILKKDHVVTLVPTEVSSLPPTNTQNTNPHLIRTASIPISDCVQVSTLVDRSDEDYTPSARRIIDSINSDHSSESKIWTADDVRRWLRRVCPQALDSPN